MKPKKMTPIIKASGETVPYLEEKLRNSLVNAGADDTQVRKIVLCKQICMDEKVLHEIGMNQYRANKVIEEGKQLSEKFKTAKGVKNKLFDSEIKSRINNSN